MTRRQPAITTITDSRAAASSVTLTIDAQGETHLTVHGLHPDTAQAAKYILEQLRRADAREDAVSRRAAMRVRR